MANRRKQIEAIQAKAATFLEEVTELRDDMQDSFDNMPESLQNGDRGEVMQQRIDTLTEWVDSLEAMSEDVE